MSVVTLPFRNRTQTFKQIRDEILRRQERFHLGLNYSNPPNPNSNTITQKLLNDTPGTHEGVELLDIKPNYLSNKLLVTTAGGGNRHQDVPQWMDKVDEAHVSLDALKEARKESMREEIFTHQNLSLVSNLQALQNRRLTMVFEQDIRSGKDNPSDLNVIAMSNIVSGYISRIETQIKAIHKGDPDSTDREIRLRENAAKAITKDLQTYTRLYRQTQSNYVQESLNCDQKSSGSAENNVLYKPSQVLLQRRMSQQHNQDFSRISRAEIEQIGALMDGVQRLFEETSTMTIEQGSMLDRVDVNVERTVENIDRGRRILHKIEEDQRKGLAKRISTVLVTLDLILMILCILKLWFRYH